MKLRILFLIRRNKTNNKNEAPIECRLTLNGKRKPFASGLFINPDNWDASKQKAVPDNLKNQQLNMKLSLITQNVNQAFLRLKITLQDFTVEDLYSEYIGEKKTVKQSLIDVYTLHNSKMEALIGKEYSQSTLRKFEESKNHLKFFMKDYYGKEDVFLENLNIKFINDFDYFLKTKKSLKQVTINKHLERLRKIIKLAIAEGHLAQDPFILFTPKKVNIEVVYLDEVELKNIENFRFKQARLQKVADMFVFCCYTGLPYLEMASLTHDNIVKGFDGGKWITVYRQKTKRLLTIPLLNKAENILNKYEHNQQLLPIISNQQFNSYLKEICNILGIEKRVTHHTARKTFASTVLLYNDIPIETVSELLGHSNIKVTQAHYAKVAQKKVSEQMRALNGKLK